MSIKGIPTDVPRSLADLIVASDHTVTSRSLVRLQTADITLFAFSEGESVSEEEYPSDTAYLCLEGTLVISVDSRSLEIAAGQAMCIPAHTTHALSGNASSAVKYLQVNA